MTAFRMRARVAALAALCTLACLAPAVAAQFSISITRVHLGAKQPIETLVLSNQEARDIAFEVHAKRWTQKADGTWDLVPTQDIVVTPIIVKLPADGDARVRVATLSPNVANEQAYRLELQELPDSPNAPAGEVRMLTMVSLPVFVEPAKATPKLELAVDAIDARHASLVLHNAGNAYAPPDNAVVRVLDQGGRTLHEGKLDTNYVLAGARLPLQADVPAAACARAATVVLTIGKDAPITAAVPAGQRRCAP
jgi:fimbrial chaperone protein